MNHFGSLLLAMETGLAVGLIILALLVGAGLAVLVTWLSFKK